MNGRRWSLEDKERGLATLAIARTSYEASEITGIPDETLRVWKCRHRERYEQLREELEAKVAKRVASGAEEIAQVITDRELKLLELLTDEELQSLKPADKAATLRNLSTSKALQIDKISSPLRERPSHVQHASSLDELLSRMERHIGKQLRPIEVPNQAEQALDGTDAVDAVDGMVLEAGSSDLNAHEA